MRELLAAIAPKVAGTKDGHTSQVEHHSSTADVGGIWLHLVIPMVCMSPREAQGAL